MIDYGIQYSTSEPQPIEMTPDAVFVASDITPYSKEIEGRVMKGYQYKYIQYTKDEFLLQQSTNILALQEQLQALLNK